MQTTYDNDNDLWNFRYISQQKILELKQPPRFILNRSCCWNRHNRYGNRPPPQFISIITNDHLFCISIFEMF